MPKFDGAAVMARLRAHRSTAAIPVVFVTAQATARQRFAALGAIGVIAKPFDPLRLAADVRRFVPVEGALAPVRDAFLQRVANDAAMLAACRRALVRKRCKEPLNRIRTLAHALAGAGGIYGFAGIGCEAAAVAEAAAQRLAGQAGQGDLDHALDRLLSRIRPTAAPSGQRRCVDDRPRYSAATA
jgi:CheY-like chemotaxis protein